MLKKTKHLPDHVLLSQFHYVYQLNTLNNTFLYFTLWIVKFAFLAFYRLLFSCSRNFLRAWWVVTLLTFTTYWVPFAGVLATCSDASTIAQYNQCNSADHARAVKLEYSCALNVATDLLIMALPLWMVKDLNINVKQKLGMVFIFSLALFCIALDILRTVEALAANQALYTVLEINMVVIIDCLPTYSTILSWRRRRMELKRKGQSYMYGSGRTDSAPIEKATVRCQEGEASGGRGTSQHGQQNRSTVELSLLDSMPKAGRGEVISNDVERGEVPAEEPVDMMRVAETQKGRSCTAITEQLK